MLVMNLTFQFHEIVIHLNQELVDYNSELIICQKALFLL